MANEVMLIDMNTLWQCETCFYHGTNGCKTWCDAGESYRPAARKFKIIDPESLRPKGRWANERILIGGLAEVWGYDCSVCGKTTEIQKYNYCPHCGARMEDFNG